MYPTTSRHLLSGSENLSRYSILDGDSASQTCKSEKCPSTAKTLPLGKSLTWDSPEFSIKSRQPKLFVWPGPIVFLSVLAMVIS